MRKLDRTIALSLGLLLGSALAPGAAEAQATPQYPEQQPGYQPAQPQPGTPGYPQPQAYPAPGYPQAYPLGYPQAYPPGYPQAYPAPGYPMQAVPPPGYYAAPAYPPPPAYEPTQSYDVTPARPAYRRGVVFMPYFGFNSVVGTGSDAFSAGFHLGGLLGGHIGPVFSLNGEMSLDIMSPKTGRSSADGSQVFFDFDLSPLFHFGIPHLEFVIGPKLGLFAYAGSSSASDEYGSSASYSGDGIAYGFTAGIFLPLGRVGLGGLFNLTVHSFSESSCDDSSYYSTCGSLPSDVTFINFSIALLI